MSNESELPEPLLALLFSTDYFDFNAKECTCLPPYKYCYGMGDKRACDVEDVEKWKKHYKEADQNVALDFDWLLENREDIDKEMEKQQKEQL